VRITQGQEARLTVVLTPKEVLPPAATFAISNGPRGSDVLLDKSKIGTLQEDGSFSAAQIPPGRHIVEIRKEGYQAIPLSRNFAANTTVTIDASRTTLLTGVLELTFAFPGRVTVARDIAGESPIYATSGKPLSLQPGTYNITVSAGNVTPQSVKVVSGEKQSVTLALH
jgi:PEGA domain